MNFTPIEEWVLKRVLEIVPSISHSLFLLVLESPPNEVQRLPFKDIFETCILILVNLILQFFLFQTLYFILFYSVTTINKQKKYFRFIQ